LSEENVPEEQVIEEGKEEFDPLRRIKGVDEKLAAVLRDCGYLSVESIAIEAPHILFERVGERAGFSLKKAEEICAEARKKLKVQGARRHPRWRRCNRRAHGGQRSVWRR
jgi:hypothetical protein